MGVEITTEPERATGSCGCLIHVKQREPGTLAEVNAQMANRFYPYQITVEPCRQHAVRVLSACNADNRDALIRSIMEMEHGRDDL